MKHKSVRGMYDVLPGYICSKEYWRMSDKWENAFHVFDKISRKHKLDFAKTPILEYQSLFLSSSGETSDIVSKEMYCFKDRGDRDVALRPEGTAGIARAISHSGMSISEARLYYFGSMFRYDRPQAGRYREHTQFGIELIGSDSAINDVETIVIGQEILESFAIKCVLKINFLCSHAFIEYQKCLAEYFKENKGIISENSVKIMHVNPMRILDSKNIKDVAACKNAPKMCDFLSAEEKERFDTIKRILNVRQIDYEVDLNLVRGLDYYTGMVFEFVDNESKAFLGGGRYNNLIKIGQDKKPAVGFGMGIERVLMQSGCIVKRSIAIRIICREESDAVINMTKDLEDVIKSKSRIISTTSLLKGRFKALKNNMEKMKYDFYIIVGRREVETEELEIASVFDEKKYKMQFEDFIHIDRILKQHFGCL